MSVDEAHANEQSLSQIDYKKHLLKDFKPDYQNFSGLFEVAQDDNESGSDCNHTREFFTEERERTINN